MTGGCVVVLGETGRNFAAGMSGGIAYVIDDTGEFSPRCNLSMVDLDRVEMGDDPILDGEPTVADLLADPLRYDSWRLRTLIERHARYADSSRAREILEDFEAQSVKFFKVTPKEYRRALEGRAAVSVGGER